MQLPRVLDLRWPILLLLIAADAALTLQWNVSVPGVVRKGDDATLVCHFDLEGDVLYSVKWYKGRREFYRYTPKENPAMKIFPVVGVHVERSRSNESHVTLKSVSQNGSGRYNCEVSADAPTFRTTIMTGEMQVIEIPEHRPLIKGLKSKYKIGDILMANCTSMLSKPAANLTWTINNNPASLSNVQQLRSLKDDVTNLETSISVINFLVTRQYFNQGKLKLKCTAKIYDIYGQSIERIIEEDKPKVILLSSDPPVGPNVNSIQLPLDQSSLHDAEMGDQNDAFMTPIQADMSSSRSAITILPYVGISLITIISTLFHLMRQQIL